MKKAKVRLRWTAKLLTIVGLMICVGGIGVLGSVNQAKNAPEFRADIIQIDAMKEIRSKKACKYFLILPT